MTKLIFLKLIIVIGLMTSPMAFAVDGFGWEFEEANGPFVSLMHPYYEQNGKKYKFYLPQSQVENAEKLFCGALSMLSAKHLEDLNTVFNPNLVDMITLKIDQSGTLVSSQTYQKIGGALYHESFVCVKKDAETSFMGSYQSKVVNPDKSVTIKGPFFMYNDQKIPFQPAMSPDHLCLAYGYLTPVREVSEYEKFIPRSLLFAYYSPQNHYVQMGIMDRYTHSIEELTCR